MTDREQDDLNKAIEGAKEFLDETIGNHDICAIHRVVEPFVKDRSIQCFECKHVYFGPVSLLVEWKRFINERADQQLVSLAKASSIDPVKVLTADDIPFCPLCLHDW